MVLEQQKAFESCFASEMVFDFTHMLSTPSCCCKCFRLQLLNCSLVASDQEPLQIVINSEPGPPYSTANMQIRQSQSAESNIYIDILLSRRVVKWDERDEG